MTHHDAERTPSRVVSKLVALSSTRKARCCSMSWVAAVPLPPCPALGHRTGVSPNASLDDTNARRQLTLADSHGRGRRILQTPMPTRLENAVRSVRSDPYNPL